MPSIVVPEPHIPCVEDPDLKASGYPLSNLGEGIKIEHTMNSACCPYTKKNCFLFLAIYILFPLAPIICLIAMCYYSNNPEIQITKHVIQGTLCPNCKMGKIKYSMIADGKCTDLKSKELFICESCFTVYPEFQLSKYFGPYPSFRQRRNS